MQEVLTKILAILEAQDAKIKALEAELKAYGDGFGTVLDSVYNQADKEHYGAFSERHRAKFEPYLDIMDKLEGGDSFRAIFDRSMDLGEEEGYEEGAYIEGMLANIIETIESLKSVVPPEAQEALADAEEAIVEAAIEAQGPAEPVEEVEIIDPAPDEWSMEDLEKQKLEGRQ
jgi:hypothetical protein